MAKKKKVPEPENLERWMVSYADFVTLLFATFVVLYALSQVDIKDFKTLETSIKQAFSAPSIMQGQDGVMQGSSSSLFDASQGDSVIAPLMMEYVSQKYEQDSMNDIQNDINSGAKEGDLDGVDAVSTERGLLISFKDDYLFKEGSADITPAAKRKLDKVGAIIAKRFILHSMRIEGHTDNQPFSNSKYPSNWELSSARACTIVRYYIGRFAFMPSVFSAVGLAYTRPVADNSTVSGRAKNRRVEILILKNKYKGQESPVNDIMKMSKEEQAKMQAKRLDTINRINQISEAAKNLVNGNTKAAKSTIILDKVYNQEMHRLDQQTNALGSSDDKWLKPPAIKDVKVFKQN